MEVTPGRAERSWAPAPWCNNPGSPVRSCTTNPLSLPVPAGFGQPELPSSLNFPAACSGPYLFPCRASSWSQRFWEQLGARRPLQGGEVLQCRGACGSSTALAPKVTSGCSAWPSHFPSLLLASVSPSAALKEGSGGTGDDCAGEWAQEAEQEAAKTLYRHFCTQQLKYMDFFCSFRNWP